MTTQTDSLPWSTPRLTCVYLVTLTDSGRAKHFTSLLDACEHAMFEHGQVLEHRDGATVKVADYTRRPRPTCLTCGQPIQRDWAGWGHARKPARRHVVKPSTTDTQKD